MFFFLNSKFCSLPSLSIFINCHKLSNFTITCHVNHFCLRVSSWSHMKQTYVEGFNSEVLHVHVKNAVTKELMRPYYWNQLWVSNYKTTGKIHATRKNSRKLQGISSQLECVHPATNLWLVFNHCLLFLEPASICGRSCSECEWYPGRHLCIIILVIARHKRVLTLSFLEWKTVNLWWLYV